MRKRRARDLEPFPAQSVSLRFLDSVVLIVGVVAPLTTLPQIVKIFELQNASGISIVTWGAYALFDIPWVFYGIAHRSRPITITYALWFVMNGAVVAGALYYGARLS
jgi:uncharacterized protein with PQ loop repeat